MWKIETIGKREEEKRYASKNTKHSP